MKLLAGRIAVDRMEDNCEEVWAYNMTSTDLNVFLDNHNEMTNLYLGMYHPLSDLGI